MSNAEIGSTFNLKDCLSQSTPGKPVIMCTFTLMQQFQVHAWYSAMVPFLQTSNDFFTLNVEH